MPVYPNDDIPSPFGSTGLNLSESDLRETAYEILVGACRTTGGKPLTYISKSQRTPVDRESPSPALETSLQRSLTSTAASKVKKALGLKKTSSLPTSNGRGTGTGNSVSQIRVKKAVTAGELVRVQMRVSEQTDSRIRRTLLRVAAGQLGRRIESMVLPLELLQHWRASDFPNLEEYEACRRRNLKVLEAGLLFFPRLSLEKTEKPAQQHLRQIIRSSLNENNESMQALRNAVMPLACRPFDRSSKSDTCHWADGFPLNLRLYQMLLEACFDLDDEASVIEEIDEVLELIKKTWLVLGINPTLHNLCFSWVLFHRYIITGQIESDLLFASNSLLVDVESIDTFEEIRDQVCPDIFGSIMTSMLSWVEKRLLMYRDYFDSRNIESFQSTVSIAVLSGKMLGEDASRKYNQKTEEVERVYDRVDMYIRSSLSHAFAQKVEKLKSSKDISKFPFLSILAREMGEMGFNEKAMFSPILKRWHPLSAGVAAATLHSCYGKELKKFVSGITNVTPDALQVLRSADKLEKDLVQIAVEDSVESDDGGKGVIREMPPYEAESAISDLVKSWIDIRVERLKEWVNRFIQQEVWNPKANKEKVAPSAVQILKIINENFEAFFLLPLPTHTTLLRKLITGLDTCLQHYISKTTSGCGSPNTYIPTLPSLTRCTTDSKFGVFKKKEKSLLVAQKRKVLVGTKNGNENSFEVPNLCARINAMQHIRTELKLLERRTTTNLKNLDNASTGIREWFDLSMGSCLEGTRQLCQATAYKVVFHDLSHVLWDGLYVGEVTLSRIEPFLQLLERYLETISSTVHDRARTRVIMDLMKASFDGFLLILLAGGPSRVFAQQDFKLLEEDFKCLCDLFWSNGDGLPLDLIEKFSAKVKDIQPLFRLDTESLIERFNRAMVETYGTSEKSRFHLPSSGSGQWNPTEPNTLLRVLCYRNDEMASKFLKKTYNLPKKL